MEFTYLTDPTGYSQQTHPMEDEFVDMCDRYPEQTDQMFVFKFNRMFSEYFIENWPAERFDNRLPYQILDEIFQELKNVRHYNYLELFREYESSIGPAMYVPFFLAVVMVISVLIVLDSMIQMLVIIFGGFVLTALFSMLLVYIAMNGFKEDMIIRSKKIETFIQQKSDTILRYKGFTMQCGPMAAWIEQIDKGPLNLGTERSHDSNFSSKMVSMRTAKLSDRIQKNLNYRGNQDESQTGLLDLDKFESYSTERSPNKQPLSAQRNADKLHSNSQPININTDLSKQLINNNTEVSKKQLTKPLNQGKKMDNLDIGSSNEQSVSINKSNTKKSIVINSDYSKKDKDIDLTKKNTNMSEAKIKKVRSSHPGKQATKKSEKKVDDADAKTVKTAKGKSTKSISPEKKKRNISKTKEIKPNESYDVPQKNNENKENVDQEQRAQSVKPKKLVKKSPGGSGKTIGNSDDGKKVKKRKVVKKKKVPKKSDESDTSEREDRPKSKTVKTRVKKSSRSVSVLRNSGSESESKPKKKVMRKVKKSKAPSVMLDEDGF